MKILTNAGVIEWLNKTNQIKDAHHDPDRASSLLHAQYYTPKAYGHIEGFVGCFVDDVVGDGELLLELHDWDPWEDFRTSLVKGIWPEFDATLSSGEAGGCLFCFAERTKAIGLFSLFTSFRWMSYLYSERDQTILFNWEGDILDTWTSSVAKHAAIQKIGTLCELKEVPSGEV